MRLVRLSILCLTLSFANTKCFSQFMQHTIVPNLKGGYQVVAADLNRDHKPDLIVVSTDMSDLVWYENPRWERHIIAQNVHHMINVAASDTDGDGIPELALAAEFDSNAQKSIGVVSILHFKGDPRQLWNMTEIDRLPTSHRLRWADIEGNGDKVLINAPLTGARAKPPDFQDSVPLVLYRRGHWSRQLISDKGQGVMHGLAIADWDGDGRDDALTGSFLGIHLHHLDPKIGWITTELTRGDPAPYPEGGTSDVAVGRLHQERFMAAIEPWHGNQVVVYRKCLGEWQRNVIDRSLIDGHTILTADLDDDGRDAIIAGMRGNGHKVYVYRSDDRQDQNWKRIALDDGDMAAASCVASDLNGDGKVDIACIGSATHNLKWYQNVIPAEKHQ
jgi:hypothetical protein